VKVRIYDDARHFAEKWAQGLKALADRVEGLDVGALGDDQFMDDMQTLMARRGRWREKGEWEPKQTTFDALDVLVIDFDLFDAQPPDRWSFTGEQVAYMVRCFSTCKLIIGMNLPTYSGNGFDLTLRGHLESYADLNIGSEQLANAGLWTSQIEGFRPWHWPIVPTYLRQIEDRIADAKRGMDKPIWQVLGMPAEQFTRLPRSIGEFLGDVPAEEATFRHLFMCSGNGLQPRDRPANGNGDPDVLARIGAARIAKWIERRLLPGQDILVDAPHLLSRFPSLLCSPSSSIDDWNAAIALEDVKASRIDADVVGPFRLQKQHWLSRPMWLWDQVRECESIKEVKEPWATQLPEWAFCEDASRFCTEFKEFRADVDSPYSLRYIKHFPDVQYQPQTRLLA
jgi:hypothetical protein